MKENIPTCPHCSGKSDISVAGERDGKVYYMVVCRQCGCRTEGWPTKEKALEIWSRRDELKHFKEEYLNKIQELIDWATEYAVLSISKYKVARKCRDLFHIPEQDK